MEMFRPKYHFTVKEGWINDPNGFCYFNGKYHLFYQYHEAPFPGCMSWGHAISDDLITFEELEPAIKHDSYYDKDGSWSGSAFVKDNKLYLMYTGHCCTENGVVQTQNIVISEDGYTFKKYEGNPVISLKDLPSDATIEDFRDPSIFKENDVYYVLLGNKSKKGVAQMLMYKSHDLLHWEFHKTLISSNELGYMLECPSTARINNKRVLITSPQGLKERGDDFWNVYSSIYAIGSRDLSKIDCMDVKEVDHGLDFYAPHIISNGDIMISWMNIWERTIPLQEMKSKWTNAFTMPRKLSLKGNKLIQKPLDHFNDRFINEVTYEGIIKKEQELESFNGRYKHIHLEFRNEGELTIKLLKKDDKYLEIKYDKDTLYLDRRNTLFPIKSFKEESSSQNYRKLKLPNKKVTLDIYIDGCFIETYINEGEEVMSITCFHPLEFDGFTLSSKNGKKVKVIGKDFR